MTLEKFKAEILDYISSEIDYEDVKSIEENAGNIWIYMNDDTVKSISIIDCEDENEEL